VSTVSSATGPTPHPFPELPSGFRFGAATAAYRIARGYSRRFGLVHADHDTLTRTPKDSYHWYRRLITAHRAQTEESTR
jgi:beta-glucosidase/6-phospho-beta-glucosidase/beta-galactosidase